MRAYGYLFFIVLTIAGCKREYQPAEENDNELITTVQVDLLKRGSSEPVVFYWDDVDGPGGDLPFIDTIKLEANSVYDVTVSFWNKSVTPAENITDEVEEESQDHRVYFIPSTGLNIVADSFDVDDAGLPLGVKSVWTTGAAVSGTMDILLRHYPNGGKEADDPANSSKSGTDGEATFPVMPAN